ncbi:hypothetical protein PINS_up001140 [Pythium insidiosum]|nr:hypothetical protein PINS_up001140 [Pythium insidiosum]
MLKIADFGLSRFWNELNSKAGRYTNKVVTLWYRSPELLLGSTSYDFSVDVWSIGCIFGELLLGRPILQGKTEIEQLQLIFGLVGMPTEENWPDFKKLPGAKDLVLDEKYVRPLRERFKNFPPHAVDLLEKLLTLDPAKRITAAEAMDHDYFWRVVTCKPRDLPKFGVSSTHEYQSKKRHHEEIAAAAAASRNVRARERGHRSTSDHQHHGSHYRNAGDQHNQHHGHQPHHYRGGEHHHYRGHHSQSLSSGNGAAAHGDSGHGHRSDRSNSSRGHRHRDGDSGEHRERERERDRSRDRDHHRHHRDRDRSR